ncbi:hypothetical protein CEXT_147381 [Caerostris extrusa]|uniref:Uncharacterized protein n=1 Tax=Caerostris extrusa TaxID=172846 RepID=A0AAV4M6Z7_CAEEX|nr:hypothetical protein CEXT_147381 [Caerostris extrusa]
MIDVGFSLFAGKVLGFWFFSHDFHFADETSKEVWGSFERSMRGVMPFEKEEKINVKKNTIFRGRGYKLLRSFARSVFFIYEESSDDVWL